MLAAGFLFFLAVIPIIPVFFWFRARNFGHLRLLLSLGAGLLAVLAAGLAQSFFHPPDTQAGIGTLLFGVFFRISLIEELSRFITLFLLFRFTYCRIPIPGDPVPSAAQGFFGAPSGLAAGLGFAAGESIFYGLTDTSAAFLRIFTAAPLHAACGARIGTALGILRKEPIRASVLVLTAVTIHSMYNFFILSPGLPFFLPGLIALSALGSSLMSLRR